MSVSGAAIPSAMLAARRRNATQHKALVVMVSGWPSPYWQPGAGLARQDGGLGREVTPPNEIPRMVQ